MSQEARAAVVVLSSPGVARRGDNPFIGLLLESYGPAVRVVPFTWARGLLGRYDVLHVHWLELLVRSDRRVARVLKRILFALLLTKLRVTGKPSVWTVHNDAPHEDEGSRTETLLLRAWNHVVTSRVFLTEAAKRRAGDPTGSRVIPHGHYRPVLVGSDGLNAVGAVRRILCFGHVRPYKGVEGLVEAYRRAWPEAGGRPSLEVVGRPKDPEYGSALQTQIGDVPGLTLRFTFLSDEALEAAIRQCDLVVLPYTRMNNSGAVLLALSVGRPVLVPASPSMQELRDELGSEWVRLFDPPLSATDLRSATEKADRHGSGELDLSRRDWGPIGAAYTSLFTSMVHDDR